MRTKPSCKCIPILLYYAALVLCGSRLSGANVGPAGYTNAFSSIPSAADWATFNRTGAPADSYDMDADVNANITAAAVVGSVVSDPGNPPPKIASASWSSTGLYLQVRPTGNRYTALMGKFVNLTGTNATEVRLAYRYTVRREAHPKTLEKEHGLISASPDSSIVGQTCRL